MSFYNHHTATLWRLSLRKKRKLERIFFNSPKLTGGETDAVLDAIRKRRLCGDGPYTQLCENWLEEKLGCVRALLTHSCTAALEMACLLIDLKPGDEVIMPSFTFSSTANAVALRGACPVFIDVDPTTMNMDVGLIEPAITDKTKSILVVHYAGRVPDMLRVAQIAKKHDLTVIEDAAQSLGATYNDEPAGTHSDLSAISFHETKNIFSGEGGALIINNPEFLDRALVIREKGTNRQKFLQGLTDKYTWTDIGSSYLPSELIAAFLSQQLKNCDEISRLRRDLWIAYRNGLKIIADENDLICPAAESDDVRLNGHLFHFLLPNRGIRGSFLSGMKSQGVDCTFHYVPLHSSPAGLKFGVAPDGCEITEDCASRLVRLPLHLNMGEAEITRVIETVNLTIRNIKT
ncbi:dTDP-4-amino-4,6-dideoxygalactose transaminase [Alphaproteobacteria bacterium]|nr:dTDP-4-amino-4,6-dideoxygalactose transaminase [Alphaproteobacteria bacterium]